jgi:hypothetical protein
VSEPLTAAQQKMLDNVKREEAMMAEKTDKTRLDKLEKVLRTWHSTLTHFIIDDETNQPCMCPHDYPGAQPSLRAAIDKFKVKR